MPKPQSIQQPWPYHPGDEITPSANVLNSNIWLRTTHPVGPPNGVFIIELGLSSVDSQIFRHTSRIVTNRNKLLTVGDLNHVKAQTFRAMADKLDNQTYFPNNKLKV